LVVGLDITNGATASLKLVTRLKPTMNVKILSKTDDETEVEVEGEDHTLMNVLKDALLRLEEVEAATYDMNPEQSGGQTEPIMYVKTDGSDPLDALQDATEEIQKDASEFREAFEGAIA
jgi:DNA-directed RNA polymerase subunit L